MTTPAVSVIIVSRLRAAALMRCILALTQQDHWLQTGGIFGQSTRQGACFRLISFRNRVKQESARLARYRPTT